MARPAGPFHLPSTGTAAPRLDGPHLTENAVEDFVRNSLSDSALAGTEEHLLLCEHCQRRVEALDRFVADLGPATIRLGVWTWLRHRRRTVPRR